MVLSKAFFFFNSELFMNHLLFQDGNAVEEIEVAAAERSFHKKFLPRNKRFSDRLGGPDSKRPRLSEFGGEVENKHLSLAPSKKIDIVMDPEDPLIDKLYTLRQVWVSYDGSSVVIRYLYLWRCKCHALL